MTNSFNQKIGADKVAANHNLDGSVQTAAIIFFCNPEFGRIRITLDDKGEPLFCGKDICEVLGYAQADKAIARHVENLDRMKRTVKVAGSRRKDGSQAIRRQQMLFVTESGLYSLVFGSKLDDALRFKLWVTSVVLPQIRKTGGFIPLNEGESEEKTIRNAEEILHKTIAQKDSLLAEKEACIAKQEACIAEQKKLLHQQCVNIAEQKKVIAEQEAQLDGKCKVIAEQETEIDRLLPKALYTDNVLDSISCYTTTQIAKELGMTAQELNRQLCACHIQYYQSGQYMLYAEYAHMGLAKSRTHFDLFIERDSIRTRMYLVWTERGRRFIHDNVRRINN